MNYLSTLGIFEGLVEFFWCVLAIIPKMIYFFFACFASAIDAMQAMIRKLAGLDVFYIKSGANSAWTSQGKEYANTDPLTEFIYGILGIGDSAATYKSLNTVFWSLSVFALIVLIVCTMIAIIKSHYNEDYASTNPWKHIYTAIKAILTYAVMPIIVVIGMQLATFVLRTLDHITAGYSSEEMLKGVYGQNVVPLFKDGTGNFDGIYGHYDYFGAGSPTSATTFGSMLFKAAAYSSNRARTGSNTQEQYLSIQHQGIGIFGNSSCAAYSSLQAGTDISTGSDVSAQVEYIAYQVDYGFQNNLRFNKSLPISTLNDAFPDVPYQHWVDAPTYQTSMGGFSKYNVTAIWFFYDLWQFNFIVAFGGGVTIFGLVLSIVFGLMSRLIKGAALFLIYPTMISIAPLDNFKAFKNWGQQFMSQVLMAIGSITAVNILMLIIPYLNSFAFFGIGIIDAIVNMVLLIVGIVMIKDFIQIVSGFIGAANAQQEGENAKGQAFNAIKSGFNTTAKIGIGTAKFGLNAGRLAGAAAIKAGKFGVKAAAKGIAAADRHRLKKKAFNKAKDKAQGAADELNAAEAELKEAQRQQQNAVGYHADEDTRQKLIAAAMASGGDGRRREGKFENSGIDDTEEHREAFAAVQAAVKKNRKNKNSTMTDEEAAIAAFNETTTGKGYNKMKQAQADLEQRNAARVAAAQANVDAKRAKLDGAVAEAKQHGHNLRSWDGGKLGVGQQFFSYKDTRDIEKAQEKGARKAEKAKAKQEKKQAKELLKQKEDAEREEAHARGERYYGHKAKAAGAAARSFGSGLDNIAKKIFNPKTAGANMADSFLKSVKAVPDALGFDKFLKGLKDTLGGALFRKGGPFENVGKGKAPEGDAARKQESDKRAEEARKQQTIANQTNSLLKSVLEQLKSQNDQLKSNNDMLKRGNEAAKEFYARAPKS